MNAYHIVAAHFPIAFWMTASVAILWRAVSDGPVARAIDQALVPLLLIGVIAGIVAFALGTQVWPLETMTASALGRNHLLLAAWTTAYWALVLVTRMIQGEAAWEGPMRVVMAGLGLIGGAFIGITGTLGGHLTGSYTEVANWLRLLGWEVYTTFYLPNLTLMIIVAASVILIGMGIMSMRRAHL
jgi:hypothetical protein